MQPLLDAMQALGGSASIEELDTKVAEIEKLPEEVLGQLHDPERGGGKSEVAYRLAWARTYLRKFGLLENSSRGVWALTEAGRKTTKVDAAEVIRFVRELDGREAVANAAPAVADLDITGPDPEAEGWRQELATVLTTALTPDAFERLAQRLLRESGFISVEVLGRSGDGGIDGKGIARIHGLMSFHIFFQCKRYTRPITPSEIRDFRGAMTGRADKGLFITTSSFTAAAVREATRDGAPPIDLINGEELANKLKELGLGVKTEMVEKVSIDPKWFEDV
ncbi:MAG: restriction endonuclease [Burkholderiales bacterium]